MRGKLHIHQRQHGMTLIELIVVLTLVAILAGIGAPAMSNLLRNSERQAAVTDYWHAIFLARSEAIKRNSVVVLCKSSDGQQCNNSADNWNGGWLVFDNQDHDEPATVDNGEPILRVYNKTPGMRIRSNRKTFAFRPFAQGGVTGTIVFCDSRGDSSARAIIISHTGRPRESDKDASNHALHCDT
jgi:type IV fimbrial biogenesis protein FimT